MKKINDLKVKRSDIITRMEALANVETLTVEQRTEWTGYDTQIKSIDNEIALLMRQEELNKSLVRTTAHTGEVTGNQEEPIRYVEALRDFFKTGKVADEYAEFRGYNNGLLLRNDLLTTTDAGLIVKDVEKTLNIAKTPILLDKLPVKKMTGMKGQFDLTAMAQITAAFVGETVAVPDASAYPQTPVTLAPRRLGAKQVVSTEALDSTNPNVWADVVQDILDAWDRKVSSDAVASLIADASNAATTISGSSFALKDALQLQANVPYDMVYPTYLASPAIAAKLAATVGLAAVEGPIWKGNIFDGTISGIPAHSSAAVPANYLIFFDAAKLTIAYFGPKTILYNPFEYDEEGELKVVVSGQVDTGFGNYRFASFYADASVA
jgi:hypothetical protein